MTYDLTAHRESAEHLARHLADHGDYTAAGHMLAAGNHMVLHNVAEALSEMALAQQEAGAPRRSDRCKALADTLHAAVTSAAAEAEARQGLPENRGSWLDGRGPRY